MTVQLYPHLPGDGGVRSFFQHLLHRGDGADSRLDDAVALGCLGEDPAQVRGKALQARSGILDVRHAEGQAALACSNGCLSGLSHAVSISSQMSPTTGQELIQSAAERPAMILFGESIIFSFSYS